MHCKIKSRFYHKFRFCYQELSAGGDRGVARIFPWGGPKYRFENLENTHSPWWGGSGYFPKLPQTGTGTRRPTGSWFWNAVVYCETRSVVFRLNLTSIAGCLGKTLKQRNSHLIPWGGWGQNVLAVFRWPIATSRFYADCRKKCTRLFMTAFYWKKKKNPPEKRRTGPLEPPLATPLGDKAWSSLGFRLLRLMSTLYHEVRFFFVCTKFN